MNVRKVEPMYRKISEQMMAKHSDPVICDSVGIEKSSHKCNDGKCGGGIPNAIEEMGRKENAGIHEAYSWNDIFSRCAGIFKIKKIKE